MEEKEYTIKELNRTVRGLETMYDIVRIIDPEECRTLVFDRQGSVHTGISCCELWGSHNRCSECSSYQACRTNQRSHKVEQRDAHQFDVFSLPIQIRLSDGTKIKCAMELITKKEEICKDDSMEKKNENTEVLLMHDKLTGLYNYEGFAAAARKEMAAHRNEKYVIGMLDVHNFSILNTQFGYEMGNFALHAAADVLRQYEEQGYVCGHIYADRFIVCASEKIFSAENLLHAMDRVNGVVHAGSYRLVFHLGLDLVEDNARPMSLMMDSALIALRSIHDQGSSCLCWFSKRMLDEAVREQRIISIFDHSLEEGCFTAYLQPQVRTDGSLCGAEALARWKMPDGKVLAPEAFIDTLERSDLITKLDVYIWEEAVKQLQKWQNTFFADVYVSINVSPKDLYYIDIPKKLLELCTGYGVDPSLLHVEFVETAFEDQNEMMQGVIKQLHEDGFIVEIDDFGKGSSSLRLLKDIDADVIKIDRDFLAETENHTKARMILEAVINLAQALHMEVITEGVESKHQVDVLSSLHCHKFQGYYFSKPIPIQEFERRYGTKKAAAAPELKLSQGRI